MPIIETEKWEKSVEVNKDPYGGCCIDVAREAMRLLDTEEYKEFDTHKLICGADDNIKAGGITGFMAGCVASLISEVHSRGDEFRKKWNSDNQIGNEGDKANESGGVLNPAVLNVSTKLNKLTKEAECPRKSRTRM